MKKVLLALVALLVAMPSVAVMDTPIDWQALEVRAVVDGQPLVVTARAEKARVTYLALRVRSHSSVVPAAELKGLPTVLLRTMRLVSPDVKSGKGPSVRVEFELVPEQAVEQRGVAEFHFQSGAYAGRLVERVIDGKLVVRESKEMGQAPRPASR
ncbi:hypothetical protein [Paucibacter sp. DJ2R-2]|uniref:hypothetical protein n=1 Tax=Paucibacter sp. DJ2R-2 TaxID=2893558 RepID=UPI0021E51004|nr:hypothetical protein [Paucibacter sp. DJ2R-2]MCV2423016.1 hypothetical protein [Paucibacter sp. DJ4R-1]MCV2440912.1 hypothetical protein [Paucibacter sp. DJ2R-2]